MFGKNPIRKVEHDASDGKLAVQEIFYTLQGEGPFSGRPAVFIRLAGCHLACKFCDTEFESGINNRMDVEQILQAARRCIPPTCYEPPLIVLTGGEPLRQKVSPLCAALLTGGFRHIQVETAGNLWGDLDFTYMVQGRNVSLVCSPKTSHLHPLVVKYCLHYKYVVQADDTHAIDGLPTLPTQANQPTYVRLPRPWDFSEVCEQVVTVWVSPCDAHEAAQTAANTHHAVQLCLKYGYRLSLQTHKMVGLP